MFNFVNNYIEPVELLEAQGSATLALPDGVYRLTITDSKESGTRWEIVDANVFEGDAYLSRGMEGTTAQDWPAGSVIYSTITAGILQMMISRLVPEGGNAGQSLVKASAGDFDTVWEDRAAAVKYITVGYNPDNSEYGYDPSYDIGDLTENAFSDIDGYVGHIKWKVYGGDYNAGLQIYMNNGEPPASVSVTIGSVTLVFTGEYYGGYGITITQEQYDALPKDGVHPITFEIT